MVFVFNVLALVASPFIQLNTSNPVALGRNSLLLGSWLATYISHPVLLRPMPCSWIPLPQTIPAVSRSTSGTNRGSSDGLRNSVGNSSARGFVPGRGRRGGGLS